MSQYDIEPIEYNMKPLDVNSIYDQFINLRDTLVFSKKWYKGKAWFKLAVGEKEETIEVLETQTYKLSFEPWDGSSFPISIQSRGSYVVGDNTYWIMWVQIKKSWRYRIEHKEEILLQAWENKIFCYFDWYPIQPDWTYPVNPSRIAVFDMQWDFSKTFTWSTSWTDPNGTCSVTVSFTLWDIIQKMTSHWVREWELKKWDILNLRCYNSDVNPNWLTFQANSNWFNIQYIDLPIN